MIGVEEDSCQKFVVVWGKAYGIDGMHYRRLFGGYLSKNSQECGYFVTEFTDASSHTASIVGPTWSDEGAGIHMASEVGDQRYRLQAVSDYAL